MRERHSQRAFGAELYARVTESDCERLHEAALSILERTGIRFPLERATALLGAAGAAVDDGDRVRIPRELVAWALKRAPRSVTLHDRAGAPAAVLDGSRTHYGPGSDCLRLLDHRSGALREPLMADVAEAVRLVEASDELDFVMSMFLPTDVDQRIADRHQMRVMLTASRKPIVFVTYDDTGCYDAVAMAEAVAGGAAELQRAPSICCYVNVTSPLWPNREALQKLLFLAERRLPFVYVPGAQAGVSTPATIAGGMAQIVAGVLGGLVLTQLAAEGAPFLVKGWGGGGLDMRTMVYGYASPEQRATAAAMARFYDLPSFALAGASDAKAVDGQAAAEAALTLAVESLSGPDLVHDLGYLESGLTGSLAQLVICTEIVTWLRHLRAPVTIDEDTLALDLIDEQGPGGQFLASRHTRRHFREHWYPTVFERETREAWQAGGAQTLATRAARRVDELLAAAPAVQAARAADELDAIVRAAEAAVQAAV
jgi:trimethylamine---corrinoid protein Co-methyltransferase